MGPCINTSVLHEGEREPSSPASSFCLCDKSRSYSLKRRMGGEALSLLDASECKQMPFTLNRPGQVTRLKLSPRERHEIKKKKKIRALHTLSCDKILWTYKEHHKPLLNKFSVRSAYNECIIST